MKKLLFLACCCLLSLGSLSAQEKAQYTIIPHWYLQAQGGGQYTLGEVDFKDLISPNAQVAVGYQFNPVIGARLAVGGWQSKAGYKKDGATKWKWNYVAPTADITVNLSNLVCGYNPNRVFNLSILGGVGANIAWKNDEAAEVSEKYFVKYLWDGTKTRFNGKFGLAADLRISRVISLGIEANANVLSDHYNSKKAGNADWYFNALAGIKFNLGKTHKQKVVAPVEPVIKYITKTKTDTVYIDRTVTVPAPAKEVVKEKLRRDIFFSINSTVISDEEAKKIAEVAEFLNKHADATVSISGVADKGTGTSSINDKLAAQRANKVSDALQKQYGISASRIKVGSDGDRIQPFAENDKNRVAICIAE